MKTISTTLFAIACAAVSACGGGDDGGGGGDDVADIDAGVSNVVSVSCAGATIAATVTTDGLAYSPVNSTIAVGDTVRFTPAGTHDVNGDEPGFDVPLGGDACFHFTAAGTYPFHCTPHGFQGSIVVQ